MKQFKPMKGPWDQCCDSQDLDHDWYLNVFVFPRFYEGYKVVRELYEF